MARVADPPQSLALGIYSPLLIQVSMQHRGAEARVPGLRVICQSAQRRLSGMSGAVNHMDASRAFYRLQCHFLLTSATAVNFLRPVGRMYRVEFERTLESD